MAHHFARTPARRAALRCLLPVAGCAAALPQAALAADAVDAGLALPAGIEIATGKAPPPPLPGGAFLRPTPSTRDNLAAAAGRGVPEQPVGEAPEEEARPEIAGALDVGGVLTPQGMLVIEPSFTYAHSGVNRFTFRGTEIVETVLLGVVEAEDADRDFLESALTLRFGLTDRLEIEARLPGVYRDDRTTTTANIAGTDVSVTDELDAFGLGDVEAAVHYQLNRGRGGWPYFVINARGKFPTGTGPFDVERDANGIETELPTGSGFYSVEPSLTVLYPSDPVVLFGNVGYVFNLAHDVDEQVGQAQVGTIDPGNAIRFGFGLSFAANESTSFSLAYSQDLIAETETEIDGVTTEAEELTVGQVSLGISHRLTQRMSVDLGTTFGVTEDATDVQLGVRFPIRLQLF